MIHSLQPKGRELESTYVLVFVFCCCFFLFVFLVCFVVLLLFDLFNFIYYRCTTTSEKCPLDHYIQKVDA